MTNVWRSGSPDTRRTDPDAATEPRETTLHAAATATNFVVFEPELLPADCEVETATLRPEQPPGRPGDVTAADLRQTPHSEGNPSTVRVVVAGDGRRLRLKQFCYDWAPSAASIAPLWRTPEPTPVEAGDAVGFLGTDYEDRRGACVQRERTQVELSVLDGGFGDEELRRLLDGLSPAAPEMATAVRTVPFHRLNYWVRYGCRPPGVPHGIWDHSPARPYDEARRVSLAGLVAGDDVPVDLSGDGPGERFPTPACETYAFDSAVAFPEAAAVEAVFRRPENLSDHLWLVAADEGSPLAPEVPPSASDQPADTRSELDVDGRTVHVAALTEADGAWEGLWADDGVRYAAWLGASQFLDGDGARAVLRELAAG